MAGAIGGTAPLDLRETEGIDIVTLTVNNSCNLDCCHCYLKYDGENRYAKNELIDWVVAEDYRHLAIVGKEPLFDKDHADKTSALIEYALNFGKSVSLITNGKNLSMLKNSESLSALDISFDGGPETYNSFRKSKYTRLIEGIRHTKAKSINALHTLYEQNIDNISDMMRISEDMSFDLIMFTPYLETQNFGSDSAKIVDLDSLLGKLVNSKNFMDSKNAILNIDIYHLRQYDCSLAKIKEKFLKLGLTYKVKLFEKDLLESGVVRVTYDGYALSPEQSLHPLYYRKGINLDSFKSKLTDVTMSLKER